MTFQSTSTHEFDVKTLVLRAYQIATLMPLQATATGSDWSAKWSAAIDFLDVEVKAIQAEGNITTDMELYPITLTQGIGSYALPESTLRVQGLAMYKQTSTDVEVQCRSMDREEYQRISNKTQQGRPVRYYPQRGINDFEVVLWMVPDTTGATLTVQRQKLMADTSDPNATFSLERSWGKCLLYRMAHNLALASGVDVQRLSYLNARADDAYKLAKSTSTQDQPNQAYVSHDSGVRR